MDAQHNFRAADEDGFVKRPPGDLFHQLCDERLTPVGRLYKTMKVHEVQGRELSSRVRSIIVESDFDLGKKLLDHTQREMRRLERQILEKIPDFERYEDYWAVEVLARRHLRHRALLKEYRTRQRVSLERRMNRKPHLCSHPRMFDASMHPTRMSKRLEGCSQSRKDDKLALQKTHRAFQERYELRDFLDEHRKTHLLFALIKSGITGDPEFSSFIDMPPAARRAFLTTALDDSAHEVDTLQLAAMQYRVIRG